MNILDPPTHPKYPTRYSFHRLLSTIQMDFRDDPIINFIEVGLGFGDYSVYMMETVHNCCVNTKVNYYSIENWAGRMMKTNMIDIREKVLARFNKYMNLPFAMSFNFIETHSVEASEKFDDESVHFIYIDANHRYRDVTKDLKAWWPKVKKGAYMSGHDYKYFRRDGVRKAVSRFFSDHGRSDDVYVTADVNPHPSWIIQK